LIRAHQRTLQLSKSLKYIEIKEKSDCKNSKSISLFMTAEKLLAEIGNMLTSS